MIKTADVLGSEDYVDIVAQCLVRASGNSLGPAEARVQARDRIEDRRAELERRRAEAQQRSVRRRR